MDEIRLCTEIAVPSKLVGRIIGKGGQNVSFLTLQAEMGNLNIKVISLKYFRSVSCNV